MTDPMKRSIDGEDREFDELFIEYIDRLNAGEGVDKAHIRASHPDRAERLIEELRRIAGAENQVPAITGLVTLTRDRIDQVIAVKGVLQPEEVTEFMREDRATLGTAGVHQEQTSPLGSGAGAH